MLTGYYTWFVSAGLLISLIYWLKQSRHDPLLPLIYFAALGGAFLGAKVAYIVSEGWMVPSPLRWQAWLVGKSITGALLGGFLSVEIFKHVLGYKKRTGDRFALILPLGISIGRLGCFKAGCCQGIICGAIGRWPAVPVEIGFNLLTWIILLTIHKQSWAKDQLFHLYLIAYGIFRFFHEFLRATEKPFGTLSGYQLIALALALTGFFAYRRRAHFCH